MSEDPGDKSFWADVLRRIQKRIRYNAEAEDLLHNAYLKLFAYRQKQNVEKPVAFMVQVAAKRSIFGVMAREWGAKASMPSNTFGTMRRFKMRFWPTANV